MLQAVHRPGGPASRNPGHQREKIKAIKDPAEPRAGIAQSDPLEGEEPEDQAAGPCGQVGLEQRPCSVASQNRGAMQSRRSSSILREETRSRAEIRRLFPRPYDGVTSLSIGIASDECDSCSSVAREVMEDTYT